MLRTNLSFYLATHVEIQPGGDGAVVSGGILKSVFIYKAENVSFSHDIR